MDPSGSKVCTKLSIKLKIDWEDKDARFYGVKRLQLHSQNLDRSSMHERMGYWVFNEMGVPAPRSTHARVVVNGEFVGLFGLTEQIDEVFARERFGNGDGNIYKEVWPLTEDGLPHADEVIIDSLETNKKAGDPGLMAEFAAALAAAPVGEELPVIEQYVDVDSFLRHVVVDRAIDHEDGALHWYCRESTGCSPHNFFWYADPSTNRLTLIPWDLDNAMDVMTGGFIGLALKIGDPFGETSNDCQPFGNGLVGGLKERSAACDRLVAGIAQLRDEYDALRAELLAGPMSEANIRARMAEWTAQIEPVIIEADEAHDDAPSLEEWQRLTTQLEKGLIESRSNDGR
jgi:hypothetical protein